MSNKLCGVVAEKCLAKSKAGRCTAQPTLLRFARSAPVPGSAVPDRKRKGSAGLAEGSGASPATTRFALLNPDSAAACQGAGLLASAGWGQPPRAAGRPCGGVPDKDSSQGSPAAAATASRPADGAVTEFATFAVGRGLFPPLAQQPASGQPLAVLPEPSNPRDANALMVVDQTCGPGPVTNPGGGPAAPGVGYLPAVVAAVLAPLMAEGLCAADVAVAEAPVSGAAPLRLTLRVLPGSWILRRSLRGPGVVFVSLILSHTG